MIDVERELEELLERKAAEVTVAPQRHRRALRRAAIRRVAVAGGAILTAAALVAGAVVGTLVFGAPDARPVPDVVDQPPRKDDFSVDDFAVDTGPTNGHVVATGTFRDLSWRLTVENFQFRNQPKRFSMELTVESANSSTGMQSFVNPKRPLGVSRGALEEEDVDYVFGWSPRTFFGNAREITLIVDGGKQEIDAPLFRTDGMHSFFVAFVPADAEVEVVRFGKRGSQRTVRAPDVEPEPDTEPRGEETVIATGEAEGEEWSFVTFDSEAGPCVEFRMVDAGNGWCYSPEDLEGMDLKLDTVFDERADSTVIVALVSERVADVEVRLGGNKAPWALLLDMVDADFEGDTDGRFAVGVFPGNQSGHTGEVRALDEQGSVVASERFSAVRPPSANDLNRFRKPQRSPKELRP